MYLSSFFCQLSSLNVATVNVLLLAWIILFGLNLNAVACRVLAHGYIRESKVDFSNL